MNSALSKQPAFKDKLAASFSGVRAWEAAGLTLIVVLAAVLRFSNLNSLGYANHYYAAGVQSMLTSWHNFFYVAAEPGGSVSLDKPPVGFWLQAVSAYFLGVNGLGVLLPQLLAGTISVIVLYRLIRRSFGTVPGLVAAFALATMPVLVATDRNNTIDSTLVLTLLLAAWAFIKATETGKLRYLLLGAGLVGLGFNVKMLQAYLPVPAFYALYFLGSREKFWAKMGKLVLTTVLLLAVSLSWALAVDLTPADRRPYVGSSSDNSETNLIVGYNGVSRLLGLFRQRANAPGTNRTLPPGITPPLLAMLIGQPGALRLFLPPLSKEVSWFLPFGLASIVLLAAGSRWRWPLTPKHQALVLWGGWLLTCVVFFSIAGFFHEYYLSMMGAPLAALAALGIYQLWELRASRPVLAMTLLLLCAAVTLGFQYYVASHFVRTAAVNFVHDLGWLPLAIGLFVIGLLSLAAAAFRSNRNSGFILLGAALVSSAMFVTPAVWSGLTNLGPTPYQPLPCAYGGGSLVPVELRDLQIDQTLLDYLEPNTRDIKYLMAVPTSLQGADYVIATGRPVLYIGGFNGQDHVVSAEDLAGLVAAGDLRYVYWNVMDVKKQADISAWLTASCTNIQGFDFSMPELSPPDGTLANTSRNKRFTSSVGRFPGDTVISLYDCRKP